MTQQQDSVPCFAIVGHPNKGKSSIVAALTQQDQIAISALSGTTTESQSFPLILSGKALYELIDTPGFQRPRQMLEQMQQSTPNAAERLLAIQGFVQTHRTQAQETGRFKDEIELLSPILSGACIIYVVDGSIPYSPEYEAEMSILQWTGQPRMALINPISGEQYVAQWQQALSQYFSLVRVFNPMTAKHDQQCAILSAFEELNPLWREHLQRAQKAINDHHHQLRLQSAYLISQYLAKALAYSTGLPEPVPALLKSTKDILRTRYQSHLKAEEMQLWQDLKTLYAHEQLQTQRQPLTLNYPDLFDQGQWFLFGLSRKKLITLAASGGAAAGAVIDLGVGGASLLAGTLLGGLTSAAATLYATETPEKIRLKNIPLGGKKLLMGPVKNLQFAFVLLGRAVNFHQALNQHSHANRNTLKIDEDEHWLDGLDKSQQAQLTRLLQKAHKGLKKSDAEQLQNIIHALQGE